MLSGAYRYNRKEYRYKGNHRTEYLILGYAHLRSNVCEDGGFKGIFLHNDSSISINVYKIFSDFDMKKKYPAVMFKGAMLVGERIPGGQSTIPRGLVSTH